MIHTWFTWLLITLLFASLIAIGFLFILMVLNAYKSYKHDKSKKTEIKKNWDIWKSLPMGPVFDKNGMEISNKDKWGWWIIWKYDEKSNLIAYKSSHHNELKFLK